MSRGRAGSKSALVGPGPFEREVMRGFGKLQIAPVIPDLPEALESECLDGRQAASTYRPGRRPHSRGLSGSGHDLLLPSGPMTIAAGLAFARALDSIPGLVSDLRTGTPCVVVEVADPLVLSGLRGIWSSLLYGRAAVVEPVTPALSSGDAQRANSLSVVVTVAPKSRDLSDHEREALAAIQFARPIVCLATDAATCLPSALVRAADHHLTLPTIDRSMIATTIRLVTGRRCRATELSQIPASADIRIADLAIAIRADRTPAECVARLARLAERSKGASGIGRDLTLGQLHGLAPAVAWARSTLDDLQAWRDGGPWSHVSSGAVLAGPPGTGKTLFAAVMAAEGGMPLITASLARWQSEDQAHLGTTLRAMRRSFEEAKLMATAGPSGRRGAVLLIDEIDSVPDRTKVTHDHRDYVVEIVNGLLEQLDGAIGREGVVVIGTTNDAARCDPALLRPGRLNRVIEISHPDLGERIGMLRVRLGPDLPEVDLSHVGRLTERMTGADIEQLVADARRIARQKDRSLELDDLLAVAGAADANCPHDLLYRTAVHEAGHALLSALEVGTEDLVVALQSREGAAGWVQRMSVKRTAWTRADVDAEIRILFGGRAAEELILGSPSAGARNDLATATSLAASVVGSWGLAGRNRLLSSRHEDTDGILAHPELRHAAGLLLARLYARTIRTLRRHRAALLRIADQLMIERRLDGPAVAALLSVAREVGIFREEVPTDEEALAFLEAGRR